MVYYVRKKMQSAFLLYIFCDDHKLYFTKTQPADYFNNNKKNGRK